MSRAGAGVLGFVLGVASVAALVHFSPEVRRALVGDPDAVPVAATVSDPLAHPLDAAPPADAVAAPAPMPPVVAPPVDPDAPTAMVDAFSGETIDADTLRLEEAARIDDACPGRVGATALTRVEFFAGEPADDTQVFPVDVESDGEVAALFVFRDVAPVVRCTYGEGADAAVIESPLPPVPSCLVESRGDVRIACPSPVDAP